MFESFVKLTRSCRRGFIYSLFQLFWTLNKTFDPLLHVKGSYTRQDSVCLLSDALQRKAMNYTVESQPGKN